MAQNICMRCGKELRAAAEQRAKEDGVSISAIAERWMILGRLAEKIMLNSESIP